MVKILYYLTILRQKSRLIFTGFLQIYCVSINTICLAKGYYVGVFIFGFLISFLWTFNISKIALSTMQDKLIYASSASIASVLGCITVNIILKNAI